MKSKNCSVCGIQIPEGRVKILPNTTTCVNHSTTERFVANVVSQGNPEAGEFTSEIEIVRDTEVANKLHQYEKQIGLYK